MPKHFQFLPKIANSHDDIYYLYEQKEKLLLPIYIEPRNTIKDTENQTTAKLLKTICTLTNMCMKSLYLYLIHENTYYFYLQLKVADTNYEINLGVEEALSVATVFGLQIEVDATIAQTHAIKITRSLLEQAQNYTS